jgi:hypothetical protein
MKKEDFLYAAAYSTRDPEAMIKAVVEEFFRIVVNRHKMDKLFDLGESMTSECTRIVNQSMLEYGYCIKKTVVKDIEPSGRSKPFQLHYLTCSSSSNEQYRIKPERKRGSYHQS